MIRLGTIEVTDEERIAVEWWHDRDDAQGRKASRRTVYLTAMAGARSWVDAAVEEFCAVKKREAQERRIMKTKSRS